MAKFGATNTQTGTQQNISATARTLLSLTAQTTGLRRAWLYDVVFGTDGTPSDFSMTYEMFRCSSIGSGGGTPTPSPLDPADTACTTVATSNQTGEPTTGVMLMAIPANVRSTYRWVASPGGELVIPATNVNGIALKAKSPGYALTGIATAHFFE